jgi:hypothetical protein
MKNERSNISDISFLNSALSGRDEFVSLFNDGFFNTPAKWEGFELTEKIPGLMDGIASRMKYSMSNLSLGVYNALDRGPCKNLAPADEIFLFTGFAEIETVNKIGKLIMEQNYSINPALFPNSVAHVALSYFTILKKASNYTVAINDGPNTNMSFVNFIIDREPLPFNYVIATGEENSLFFSYEINETLHIVPSFAAYKISTGCERGFKFIKTVKSLDELTDDGSFKAGDKIFCGIETFVNLKKMFPDREIYTEYPLVRDNPCGIILRLAMPFHLGLTGISIVIEKVKSEYYIFEVVL